MKTWLSFLTILLFNLPAFGEDVKVFAAAALRAPLVEIAAEYEGATGNKVTFVFDTAGASEQKFTAEPQAAFLITTETVIRDAERGGRLQNGITRPLAEAVAGFAAPPGSARPDVSTPEKLKAALLAAPRIAFSDPARGATVGIHFLSVIESLGIKDEVLKKATLARDGAETMSLVLEKKVDLAVTQISEIIQANRDALVGPFPKQFDLATTYSLWHRTNVSSAQINFVMLIMNRLTPAKLAETGLRAAPQ